MTDRSSLTETGLIGWFMGTFHVNQPNLNNFPGKKRLCFLKKNNINSDLKTSTY